MDTSEFAVLYQEFHRRVLAFTLRRAPRDVAVEATDQAFLIAWSRRDKIPSSPLPWLLVIARNVLYEQYRSQARQDVLAVELTLLTSSVEHPTDAVVERMSVLAGLGSLLSSDREALMLTVWDGLSNSEAAKVTGCSTATFAVRLHRARRRLAAALKAAEAQPPPPTTSVTTSQPPRPSTSALGSSLTGHQP